MQIVTPGVYFTEHKCKADSFILLVLPQIKERMLNRIPFLLLACLMFVAGKAEAQRSSRADAALSQLMEGNFLQAKKSADDVLRTENNNSIAYVVRAAGFAFENKMTAGQADMEKAAKISPESGVVQGFLANYYYMVSNDQLSKKAAEKAIALLHAPDSAIEYYARGLANDQLKRIDLAIDDFTKAIQLNPKYLRALAFRANLYKQKNQIDLAFNDYTRCIQSNTAYSIPYYYRGNIYLDRGNNELAIADYLKAVQNDPTNSGAWMQANYAYCRMKQYDRALDCLNKAEAINPNDNMIVYQRGNIYFDMGKHEQAIEQYNALERKDPKTGWSHIQKARICKQQGKLEDALVELNSACLKEPNNATAWIERGNVFFAAQMWEDAVKDYQKAAQLDPKMSNAQMNIGCVNFQLQYFSEALTNFNRAIEIDPNNALAYINRADTYTALGKTKEAEADKKKYVQLGGQLAPEGGKTHSDIFPSGNFDANLAKAALQRGSSTIKGRACTRTDGMIFDASGVTVVLYPVTPYLEEWYELRDKKEGKKTSVFMSREAVKFCITTKCDRDGRFVFEGLKPGRYFIQIMHSFNQLKTARVYEGSNTIQNGPVRETTNYYRDYDYTVARAKRLEKFVEIKDDGDTKKITISNGLIKSCSGIL